MVVPFRMPVISSIRSPSRQRYRGRIMGIPPPTLASKKKFTRFCRAISRSSVPWAATNALLEVATCLPASRQAFTKGYAGFNPPMASTTIRISSSSSICLKSWMILSATGLSGKSRRSRTYFRRISCPAFSLITSLFSSRISATPEPMVPYPIIAALIIFPLSVSCLFTILPRITPTPWKGSLHNVPHLLPPDPRSCWTYFPCSPAPPRSESMWPRH